MQHLTNFMLRGIAIAVTCMVLLSIRAVAQIPTTMSFQGELGSGIGANSSQTLTFRIYTSATGGTAIWSESQTVTLNVRMFNVILGSSTALAIPFDRQYWIGVTVGSGSELSPRVQLTSAPYSLNTAKIGGRSVTSATPSDGQVLKWNNSTSQWEPGANTVAGSAGGDLGGTYPNPSIASGAVTTSKINDGAVTDAKVASGISYSKLSGAPTSLPPGGSAGGDLGGSYPNPSVAQVGGITASSVASGADAANAATSTNSASTIVKRDGSGNFSAGVITAGLTGNVTGNVSGTASSITGSITESQVTNLTGDLAAKANDNMVVHLTGDEIIGGTKSFTSPLNADITGNAASATTAGSFTGNLTGDVTSIGMSTAIASSAGGHLITAINNALATIDAARIGSGLIDNQVDNNLTINGGAIDDSPIGATTRSSGRFSTLDATGGLTISAGTVLLPDGQIDNAELAHPSLSVNAGTGLTGGGSVALGGSTTLNLANTSVNPGSYTNTNITVDAQGRITSATNGTNGTVTSINVSSGTTGLTTTGGPVTTSGTITLGGTLGTANGGTGTSTAFTPGSVVFAGSGGTYAQNNASFFWNNSSPFLGIGTNSPGLIMQQSFPPANQRGITISNPNVVGGGAAAIIEGQSTNQASNFDMLRLSAFDGTARVAELALMTDNSPTDGRVTIRTRQGGGFFDRLTVTPGGDVGIGTNLPALRAVQGPYKKSLTIEDPGFSGGGGTTVGAVLDGINANGAANQDVFNIGAWDGHPNPGDESSHIGDITFATGSSSTSGYIRFLTKPNGSAIAERMRIWEDGSVGIGTTSPGQKLDVNGNVKFSGALMPNGSAGTSGQLLKSSGSGSAPTWGALTASDIPIIAESQVANLTGDLAAKANDNAVVHLTGNETIGGTKTFSSPISGNITGSAASFTGSLAGDVAGTQSATTVGKLQGRTVASTLPTNGQVLSWNNTSSQWEPTAPSNALTLPFSGSTASSSDAFAATTTGTGAAGNFAISNASSSADALIATTNGTGDAIRANGNIRLAGTFKPGGVAGTSGQVLKSNGSASAPSWAADGLTLPFSSSTSSGSKLIDVTNTGTGGAGSFVINSTTPGSGGTPALTVSSNNLIKALSVTSTGNFNGQGAAIDATASGSGSAGNFTSSGNFTGQPPAVTVTATGNASAAGSFTMNNASSSANALTATTNGSGAAISATNTTSGSAGNFTINNSLSSANALVVSTNGTGNAISATGNIVASGSVTIGGGAAITNVLTATSALDFSSTSAGSSADLTITVTGAALGDVVFIGAPNGSVVANTNFTAWVSASNTVTVRFNNYSGSSADPSSGTFRVTVMKF